MLEEERLAVERVDGNVLSAAYVRHGDVQGGGIVGHRRPRMGEMDGGRRLTI